jgi:hypothetical protein
LPTPAPYASVTERFSLENWLETAEPYLHTRVLNSSSLILVFSADPKDLFSIEFHLDDCVERRIFAARIASLNHLELPASEIAFSFTPDHCVSQLQLPFLNNEILGRIPSDDHAVSVVVRLTEKPLPSGLPVVSVASLPAPSVPYVGLMNQGATFI